MFGATGRPGPLVLGGGGGGGELFKLVGIDRFDEIGVESGGEGVVSIAGFAEAGDGDEAGSIGQLFADKAGDLIAIEFGEGDVENGDVGPLIADAVEGGLTVVGRGDDFET